MENAFEFIDLTVRALPFGSRAETLDPLDEQTAIPLAVEDGDFAAAR